MQKANYTKADFHGSRLNHVCKVDHFQFEEEVRSGQYARFTGFCECGAATDGYATPDGFDDESGKLEWSEPDFEAFDLEEFEDRLEEGFKKIQAEYDGETGEFSGFEIEEVVA